MTFIESFTYFNTTQRKTCPYLELFLSAFSGIRLNTGRNFESLRIQSGCGKMRTRITPNTGKVIHSVIFFELNAILAKIEQRTLFLGA